MLGRWSLVNWVSEMSEAPDSADLAFHLVDPSKLHFKYLFLPLPLAYQNSALVWYALGQGEFWAYTWHQLPAMKTMAILCNLL